MSKERIIFLGSKPVGYKCLEILLEKAPEGEVEVAGVLTKDHSRCEKEFNVRELAEKRGVPLISNLDEILGRDDIDYLISVQYHQILRREHIDVAKEIAVNLHMAPLPEYRGCNQFSFAIIEEKKLFGTTLHRLEEGIDKGAIIAERRFEIPDDITVKRLYDLTVKHSVELFSEEIVNILRGEFDLLPQEKLIKERGTSLHYRKEIEDLRKIDLSWSTEKIERYVRATSMPGFKPPYILLGERKIYFVLEEYYEEKQNR